MKLYMSFWLNENCVYLHISHDNINYLLFKYLVEKIGFHVIFAILNLTTCKGCSINVAIYLNHLFRCHILVRNRNISVSLNNYCIVISTPFLAYLQNNTYNQKRKMKRKEPDQRKRFTCFVNIIFPLPSWVIRMCTKNTQNHAVC